MTVAPITTTIRGLSTEVQVGRENGLDHAGVVSCDNLATVPASTVGRLVGHLLPAQELKLAEAMRIAFDLT